MSFDQKNLLIYQQINTVRLGQTIPELLDSEFHTCNKIPDITHLGKEGFILADSFNSFSSCLAASVGSPVERQSPLIKGLSVQNTSW